MRIELPKDGVWYHGACQRFDYLRAGSTITPWRALAEAFSHQPTRLGYDDDGNIFHNGKEPGVLYVIDEPVEIGRDIYQHPRTTMDENAEFLTRRPLRVRLIAELPLPAEAPKPAKGGIHSMQTRTFASLMEQYERLIVRPNPVNERFYNGIYSRYAHPVLTREHIPPFWMYDADPAANPYMMQRLGVNAVMNSGALKVNGRYCLVARVEGMDRKSFFAVAESDRPTEGFRFRDYPVVLPDTCPEETNVYDMRLTQHEDGWIYGVFCSESKDTSSGDLSAAVAAAGIVRTRDLETWERLPNLVTLRSPQQRNVVLHPEFVDGKYAFYTRPMDDFIETGSGGGIGFGLCEDITHAVIDEEKIISLRRYHTITESKNGAGAVPIKTARGWIHIAHGVRNTAAGLRYVLYAFATDLADPSRVIAEPSGMLLGPMGHERVGDVSNVTFTNGAILDDDGKVYIYYASSDTRLHVAETDVDRLCDYVFNTPADPLRSPDCVRQRCDLIRKNLAFMEK